MSDHKQPRTFWCRLPVVFLLVFGTMFIGGLYLMVVMD